MGRRVATCPGVPNQYTLSQKSIHHGKPLRSRRHEFPRVCASPFTNDQLLAHLEQPRFEQSSNHQTPFPQLHSLFRRRNLSITQPLRRRLLRRAILPIIPARKAHSMLIRRIILILIVRKRRSRMGCGRRLGIARCLLSGWLPGVSLVSEKIHGEVIDGQAA